ncbi:ABC transporter permease [Thioclava kandeliae]|uniref:ABC transporter permease n=1 Tax=Thioclava kandeliae TaxID=3070818 RepID=A0ABV1SM32_9RHOB
MLSSPATETQITHLQRLWLYIFVALVAIYLLLPVLIVAPMSFSDSRFLKFPPENFSLRWYQSYFGSSEWQAATWVSLRAAVLTTVIATPLGVMAAYGLARTEIFGARFILLALLSPLVVPVIIIAIGLFYLYARLSLVNTMTGVVLAHTVLAIPFVIITTSSALAQFDVNLEKAARSLGASLLRSFLTVTLPQIGPAVMSGALFAFITSLDEVVISSFISGGETTTLTKKMFTGLRDQVDPTIAAVSTILIAVSISILIIAMLFAGRNRQKS